MQHPTEEDKALARRLRCARLSQRRKVAEVAASIGISDARLMHYEMARRRPSASVVEAWEVTLS